MKTVAGRLEEAFCAVADAGPVSFGRSRARLQTAVPEFRSFMVEPVKDEWDILCPAQVGRPPRLVVSGVSLWPFIIRKELHTHVHSFFYRASPLAWLTLPCVDKEDCASVQPIHIVSIVSPAQHK
jgi:hypothetical protein